MTATETAAERPQYRFVGTRPVRHDGLDKVTGRARFAADCDLPGQLDGYVVRSPHAHARIAAIDTAEAEAMPGVKAVITGADFPSVAPGDANYDMCVNLMARDKALYEGHAVAAVAAVSAEQARAAAAAVKVQYEPLPPVLTIDDALNPAVPAIHDHMRTSGVDPAPAEPSNVSQLTNFARGDVEAGFAEADTVIEREFTTQPVHQGYIEPHAVTADAGQDGKATVWCSSQGHFNVRAQTAAMLGWETARIKVVPAEIGGGFGGKTTVYLEPLAVRLSAKAGRPVKMVMTRSEVFRATGPAPGSRFKVKLGARSDGTLTAGKAEMVYSSGVFPGYAAFLGAWTVFESYDIANFEIEARNVVLNTPRSAAYRAPSAPMSALATETIVDELAKGLGIDPIEMRLRNAVTEGDINTLGAPFPRVGFVECLEAIRDHPHYSAPLGPNQGRGLASGHWFNIGESSSATVNLNEDGTATVVTGSPDIGGSRASMALMAAEELGIDVYDITPVVGDTESVGFTDITEGSRATFATGMAVVEACRQVVDDLRGRAAKMMGVDVAEVEWADGSAVHSGGDHDPLPLAAITAEAKKTGGPITATGSLDAKGVGPSFAVHLCDVEADPETGVVRVVRYTAAQDAGTAIHPSYVEGQIQGGAAQGIGWALNEEYMYDGDGVMENPGFLDYRVPVASDLPMIDAVIVEVPNPNHPYGVRGVGETSIVPPLAAVANAVAAATGRRIRDLPISPMRVLDAIVNGDAGGGAAAGGNGSAG